MSPDEARELADAIARLRDATGPGGYHRQDVLLVCDAAAEQLPWEPVLATCGVCSSPGHRSEECPHGGRR